MIQYCCMLNALLFDNVFLFSLRAPILAFANFRTMYVTVDIYSRNMTTSVTHTLHCLKLLLARLNQKVVLLIVQPSHIMNGNFFIISQLMNKL